MINYHRYFKETVKKSLQYELVMVLVDAQSCSPQIHMYFGYVPRNKLIPFDLDLRH